MELCLDLNTLPQKSESLIYSPDKNSPPDALWTRELPRWVFTEVWIVSSFLLQDELVCRFGDMVFEHIRRDGRGYHLHLAIAGGGSFTDMSTSLLARFECRENGAKTSRFGAKFVIEPFLKRTVTPDTKVLVKEQEVVDLQSLNPLPRVVERISPRGERYFIPVVDIMSSGIENTFQVGLFKQEIRDSHAETVLVGSYSSILACIHQRMWKKAQNVLRVNNSGSGGSVLAEHIRAQSRLGLFWKPSILLYCSATKTEIDANLEREKFVMGKIVEIFYLKRVQYESNCVSDCTSIKIIDVICKSGKGSGSFTGSDKLKHGILHHILRREVSHFVTNNKH
jgi:hypothetical protein